MAATADEREREREEAALGYERNQAEDRREAEREQRWAAHIAEYPRQGHRQARPDVRADAQGPSATGDSDRSERDTRIRPKVWRSPE